MNTVPNFIAINPKVTNRSTDTLSKLQLTTKSLALDLSYFPIFHIIVVFCPFSQQRFLLITAGKAQVLLITLTLSNLNGPVSHATTSMYVISALALIK